VANAIYVAYGVMLDVPPIYIGCAIAVILHSYGIYMVDKTHMLTPVTGMLTPSDRSWV